MSMGLGASRPKSDINITPLVDVLLVLIIIFMIITPILQKGFDAQVPEKAEPKVGAPPPNVIVLQIEANGGLAINRSPVTFGDLGERLSAIYATRPDRILFVDADDRAKYEDVVKALDIARSQGGVATIGFVLN
jgi:biopolymer transport protein ExbD